MSKYTLSGRELSVDDFVETARSYARTITQGRWRWFGDTKVQDIYLATPERGREFVMRFKRWGMQHAQPVFRDEERYMMHDSVADIVKYEVGDPEIVGRKMLNGTVYREDIRALDHPDASFIAHAPELVNGLLARIDELEAELAQHTNKEKQ